MTEINPQSGLTVSEGQGAALRLTVPGRDLSSETVRVHLIGSLGEAREIGAQAGAAAGVEFVVDVTFDVPPGRYTMEATIDDEPAAYPSFFDQGGRHVERPTVRIIDSPSND
jgi:hypothetical protein